MPLNDPVPSNALDVLKRNAEDFDKLVNSDDASVTNRVGEAALTVAEYNRRALAQLANAEQQIESAITGGLYVPVGDFGTEFTINERREVGYDGSVYWRWNGALPHTVLATDTPSSPDWTDVTQATLAADLLNEAESGNRVAAMTIQANSVKDLSNRPLIDGREYCTSGFYEDIAGGGDTFIYIASKDKITHDGLDVISPEAIGAFNGLPSDISTLIEWSGTGTGCFVRKNATQKKDMEKYGAVYQDEALDCGYIHNKLVDLLKNRTVTSGGEIHYTDRAYHSTPLKLDSFIDVIGDTESLILQQVSDNHGFDIAANSRQCKVKNLRVLGNVTAKASGKNGFNFDLANAGEGQVYEDLTVQGWDSGFRNGNLFWNSTLKNIRCNSNNRDFNNDGTDGQCINNLVHKFYSNQPAISGFRIGAWKNSSFLVCNFGGAETPDNPTRAMDFIGNSTMLTIAGCNFEHFYVGEDRGILEFWSDTTALASGNVFANNQTANGVTRAFHIRGRDTSFVTAISNEAIIKNDMKDFLISNDASMALQLNTGMDLTTDFSSDSFIKYDDIISDYMNGLLPKTYKGTNSVTAGSFLDTGKGSLVNQFIPQVRGVSGNNPTVVCNAAEYGSGGVVKIRFSNIADGTENFGTYTVDWVAY